MKPFAELNELMVRRLEQAGTLAPGSASAILGAMKARKQLDVHPSSFAADLTAFFLGTGEYGPETPGEIDARRKTEAESGSSIPPRVPKPDGRRYLTAEAEVATQRGGGLSRAMPILEVMVAYHRDGGLADRLEESMKALGSKRRRGAEGDSLSEFLEAREPHAAAEWVAEALMEDRAARDIVHGDWRPDLPASEVRVQEVLGKLASEYGVSLADPVGVAAKWGQTIGRSYYKTHDLARVILARLSAQDAHLLDARSAKVPTYDPVAFGEYAERERESPDDSVRRLHAGYL
jgi:hypothetical protein